MKHIRSGLGLSWDNRAALTLHELGELIRRAGKEVGLIPLSEHKIKVNASEHVKKIDWVWVAKVGDRPVVAFEIEGPRVPKKSIVNDVRKFKKCEAEISIVALFHVDHDLSEKPYPPYKRDPKEWVRSHEEDFDFEIYFDEELMAKNGIEAIQKDAMRALKKRNN